MATKLDRAQLALNTATEYCLFWNAFDATQRPRCPDKEFSEWRCCPYHRFLGWKSKEFDRKLAKVQQQIGFQSEGQTGSKTWWSDLFSAVGQPMPPILDQYFLIHAMKFFSYLYKEFGLEAVIWMLEEHTPEEVLNLSRLSLLNSQHKKVAKYLKSLLAKYGLEAVRRTLAIEKKGGDFANRFTHTFSALPV